MTDEEHLHLLHARRRELPVEEQAKLNTRRLGLLCEPFREFADKGESWRSLRWSMLSCLRCIRCKDEVAC